MTVDWCDVQDSSRVVAEAYLPEIETILVRFPDGTEWAYSACPPATWEAFTSPEQSRGQYIADVLDAKPNGRWTS